MPFTRLNHSCESFVKNDDMDNEVEFYNVPDTRITDMLEAVYADPE